MYVYYWMDFDGWGVEYTIAWFYNRPDVYFKNGYLTECHWMVPGTYED